jgi:geranylgeranyl pyrophosphate synthase
MLQFSDVLNVDYNRIMPFIMVADLMMAAAMNDDDIIDNNSERCGESSLWKIRGINSTIMVTGYMYALIFSVLKRYRPSSSDNDFAAYVRSEGLLMDYFREMNIAQYRTTICGNDVATFSLEDLEKLAIQKASLLFQFCTSVPAYFSGKYVNEIEDFGYQLGIARQYISDVQDFMVVPGDNYKSGIRMEDYFTHQPNLVLVLTRESNALTPDERDWFIQNWSNSIPQEDVVKTTDKVSGLILKANAIDEAKNILKKIQDKLQRSISVIPDESFKNNMSKWAFRSFPMD